VTTSSYAREREALDMDMYHVMFSGILSDFQLLSVLAKYHQLFIQMMSERLTSAQWTTVCKNFCFGASWFLRHSIACGAGVVAESSRCSSGAS